MRYIITNLLILLIPFITTVGYYLVSSRSMAESVDSIAELQLASDIDYIDQKLKDLDKQSEKLMLDYDVARYLNSTGEISDIELYNSRRVSERLSSLVTGGGFLSRSFLFLKNSNMVIMDDGFSSFDAFYGNIFSIEGYDSISWKRLIFARRPQTGAILSGFQAYESGKPYPAHLYIKQIGMGDHHRGAIVAVIDGELLGRELTRLPELYEGWLLVANESGNVIACSSPDKSRELLYIASQNPDKHQVSVQDKVYRMYSKASAYNGWTYTAFLRKSLITADLVKVRNIALILLLSGFFLGIIISWVTAFSNSRPMERMFSLLSMRVQERSLKLDSVYTSAEDAIRGLAATKEELEKEVRTVTDTTKFYFLQNLLRGEYHDRKLFEEDRDRFGISFAARPYAIAVVRLSSFALALDTGNQIEISSTLQELLKAHISGDEYVVKMPTGSISVILKIKKPSEYRAAAESFIDTINSHLSYKMKEYLLFGIGTPVPDAFLLPISFNEAEAASLSINQESRSRMCFYDDFPAASFTYKYPLHLEEAISRAIRGSNIELLGSLISLLRDENFKERNLGHREAENLVLAFRGTALRLQNEFPDDFGVFTDVLNSAVGIHAPPEAFNEIAAILFQMANVREQGKKSHKTRLAVEIRNYITNNLRAPALGLSSVAEKFNLSENYLSAFFKEQEGEDLASYILRIRMETATRLIDENRGMSIDDVAKACGYASASSFRRAFKRQYGLSPSEYKYGNV